MRSGPHLLALTGVFSLATGVLADPIGTRDGQCYRAKWVQARETDCNQVCRNAGMSAESMNLSSAGAQKIFVCRHKGSKYYAFGEQGSGNCRVVDGSIVRKERGYECLCARVGCVARDSESRAREGPNSGETTRNGISEEQCVRSLQATIERLRTQPDREAYAEARRHCAVGDFKGAINAIMTRE